MVGDSNVGKTSLLDRFVKDQFTDQYRATIGSDFLTKDMLVDGRTVTLQLWDTAGQERFRGLGSAFYRGADGCIIVYDVTVRSSFDNVENWKNEFLAHGAIKNSSDFPIAVVGNKIDMGEKDVPPELVQELTNSLDNVSHYEVSAKESTNVNRVFQDIVENVTKYYGTEHQAPVDVTPNVSLAQYTAPPDDKCAC